MNTDKFADDIMPTWNGNSYGKWEKGDLAAGFAEGCIQSRAVWGGGETPALKGIVNPETIVLAGSAIGQIKPKSRRIIGDVPIYVAHDSSDVWSNPKYFCK